MKILIIRFSSIGDIVLTTPVLRCLKEQMPDAEIHYLTKKQYIPILQSNPFISKVHLLKDNYQELIPKLRKEDFDYIVDLHKNIRSLYIRLRLGKPASSFPKLNLQKWLITRFKLDFLPRVHIVDRYFRAVGGLGISNDRKGLDYFLLDAEKVGIPETFPEISGDFFALAIGARHQTKIFPAAKVASLCDLLSLPVVLLGGKEDMTRGEEIRERTKHTVINACGLLTLNGSASVILQAAAVITNDTGMMHIAAAFRKPVVSIWGNTIPEFGMYPYLPLGMEKRSAIIEMKGLRCRPCSKLGYRECPEKHFDCMKKIEINEIFEAVENVGRL